jgi:stearoyl-CoA desaturase (delta-9 desaturase)
MTPSSSRTVFAWAAGFTWLPFLFFIGMHLTPLLLFFTGFSFQDFIALLMFYALQIFGISAGYHRYFSHRSFRAGRGMQFFLAWLGSMPFQHLFSWAGLHRHHHRVSDTEIDLHSPIRGFLWSHILWIFAKRDLHGIAQTVPDLQKFPELRFLDRFFYLPACVSILISYAYGGWSMVVGGFLLSVLFVWHAMFSINSLTHIIGSRRYATNDMSRNSFLLALVTFGEGWHNNHHHFSSSTRQGFFWWELDLSYLILRVFALLGLVHDLRDPLPAHKQFRLLREGDEDIGLVTALARMRTLAPQHPLWIRVLTHVLTIGATIASLTLLVLVGAIQAQAAFIVGASIFGAATLAFFILHIWQFGTSLANLALFVAGAFTPLLILLGMQNGWGWALLSLMWSITGATALFPFMRRHQRLVKRISLSLLLSIAALALFIGRDIFFANNSAALFLWTSIACITFAYTTLPIWNVFRLRVAFHLFLLAGSVSYSLFLHQLAFVV